MTHGAACSPPMPPVVVPCGFGPAVQVGGRLPDDRDDHPGPGVERGDAMLRVCGAVELDAGDRLRLDTGLGSVHREVPRPRRSQLGATAGRPVPVDVVTWGDTTRVVDLGAPSDVDTVLVVRENANPGWTAQQGDRPCNRSASTAGRRGGWCRPGRAGRSTCASGRNAPSWSSSSSGPRWPRRSWRWPSSVVGGVRHPC